MTSWGVGGGSTVCSISVEVPPPYRNKARVTTYNFSSNHNSDVEKKEKKAVVFYCAQGHKGEIVLLN